MPAVLALPSTCLRCQLHAIVRQTGPLRNAPTHIAHRCQTFSTHHPRSQETERRQLSGKLKVGTKWRSVALLDGNRGARPKPIIVLEDIPKANMAKDKARDNSQQVGHAVVERKISQEDADRSPSAKQIESVVSERHKAPAQAEVNASLEAMRAEATKKSTVISTSRFEVLLRDLTDGYTIHQLGRYLDRSIQSPSKKVYDFQTSPWRPGRTPLSQRHVKEIRKKGPSTKMRISEQILRLVWEITVEAEENRDGEMEIKLKPWQTSLLFDLTSNGTRYLDGLVTPQTLIQNSEIQLCQPDNVMRITGRCQTAEEIARQVKLALLKVHRLEWDLKPLASFEKKSETTLHAVFRSEDIGYVARLTESVIASEAEGQLAIYSSSRMGVLNARRLLLALLDQGQGSDQDVGSSFSDKAGACFDMPVGNSKVGVHRRYHGLDLVRTVKPVATSDNSAGDDLTLARTKMDEFATSLARQLDSIGGLRKIGSSTEHDNSYWRRESTSTGWKAKFCMLLHPNGKDQMAASNLEDSTRLDNIIQHAIPGLENLLAFFEAPKDSVLPRSANKHSTTMQNSGGKMLPYIKVHLRPSPQARNSTIALPRLEMRFHFSESKTGTGPRQLMLTGMQAVMYEQRLFVSLPGYATDLLLTRISKLLAKVDALKADANIMAFVRQLQKSAHRDEGALTAPAELSVKLPPWLIQDEDPEVSATTQEITIKYLFERIEEIQKVEFAPRPDEEQDLEMDADVECTLDGLPENLRLDYREVEGGAIYGNTSVLSLSLGKTKRLLRPVAAALEQSEQASRTPSDSSSLKIAGYALRIAHLLTRASSGSLKRRSKKA